MKRLYTFMTLAALMMLLPISVVAQEELTVADSTSTNSYIPAYGFYADYDQHVQIVYPSSLLSEMENASITQMMFYVTSNVWYFDMGATFAISLGETSGFTGFPSSANPVSTTLTQVFQGELANGAGNTVSIEFEEGYAYEGGDLVVDIVYTSHGDANYYAYTYFYGQTQSMYTAFNQYGTSTYTRQHFLPKTTFTYEAGSGEPVCRKPSGLQVTDITVDGATLHWTARNDESSWRVFIDGVETDDSPVSDTSYVVSGLTASSNHTLGVSAICGTDFESGIATVNFRTLCGAVLLPWGEDFDNVSSITGLDCWQRFSSLYADAAFSVDALETSTDGWTLRTTGMPSQNLVLNIYGTSCHHWIATPELTMGTNTMVTFELALTNYNYSSTPSVSNVADDRFIVFVLNTDDQTLTPLAKWGSQVGTRDDYAFDALSNTSTTVTLSLADYAGQNVRLLFYGESTTSGGDNDLHIDDLMVTEDNGCNRPASASVSGITYEGATVSWTSGGDAITGYTVRVAQSNDLNAATAQDFEASSSPYLLEGLTGNTTYYVWVRGNCGDDNTLWRAAGSFTTDQDCYAVQDLRVADLNMNSALVTWTVLQRGRECDGVLLTLVDITGTQPDTIDEVTATGTHHFLTGLEGGHNYRVTAKTLCGSYSATAQTVTFTTESCGRIEGTTTCTYMPFYAYYKYGYSQAIYPATKLQGLSEITAIQYRQASTPSSEYNRVIKVYMATSDATLLDTNDYISADDMTLVFNGVLNVSQTGWKTITLIEPFQYDGQSNIVVAVQNITGAYNNFSWGGHTATDDESNGVYWYTDDFIITPENPNARGGTDNNLPIRGKSFTVPDITFVGECSTPECLAPLVTTGDIDETSIALTWMAGSEESSWVVEYRQSGDTAWTVYTTASTTETTVNDLEANTLYELRVGSLCGDATLYCPVITCRTACSTISLPYTESFEGWSGDYPFHACWHKILSAGNYPYINNSANYTASGSSALYSSASSGQVSLIASPLIPDEANSLRVTFWARNWSVSGTATQAGVLADVANPSSFEACRVTATGAQHDDMQEYEFYTDSVNATGYAYVAFRIATSSIIYLDDVTVSLASNCRRPNTPSVTSIGFYTATLHWVDINNGATAYQVCYNTENSLADATLLDITAYGDSVELDGLQNGQTYYMWVRPACSTDEADWLPMPSFTTQVSCYPVNGLRQSSSSLNTIAIEWSYNTAEGLTPQGAVVSLLDLADGSWVIEDQPTTSSSYIFTGLESSHSYKVFVTTVCDPDSSAAAQLVVSTAIPNCGEVVGTDSARYYPSYGYYNYSYTQTLYPASLAATSDTIYGISLRVARYAQTRTWDIYLANTTLQSLSTTSFVPASSLTLVAANYTFNGSVGWVDIIFDAPFANNGDNLVLAICDKTGSYSFSSYMYFGHHATATTSTVYSYNDDIAYIPASVTSFDSTVYYATDLRINGNCDLENSCMAPVVVLTGTDISSASLQWASDNGSSYSVQYRAMADTGWTTYIESTTALTATVTGLESSTGYMFRVGTDCDGITLWSQPLAGYTTCAAVDAPQTYTFANELSPCWLITGSNISRSTSENALYFTGYSYSTLNSAILPEFNDAISTLKITLHARYGYSSEGIDVSIGNANGSNATLVESIQLTSSYDYYTVYLDQYSGSDNRIILSKSGINSSVYVDSIWVEVAESCRKVSAITANNVTHSSASIVWMAQTAAASYEVEYRANGTTTWLTATANGTIATLTGLDASTSYEVRVRSICSTSEQSDWAYGSFRTLCTAISTLPYTEDFESHTVDYEPDCWTVVVESNGSTITAGGHSGSKCLLNESYYYYGTSTLVATPLITTAANSLSGTVWVKAYTETESYYSYETEIAALGVQIGIMTDPTDASTFVAILDTTILAEDWTQVSFSAAACGITANAALAFRSTQNYSEDNGYLYIDDLYITTSGSQPSTCDAPAISSATATEGSISLQWTATAQSYEVAIVQGSSLTSAATVTPVSNTAYTFSGLTPATTYTVGVRSVCGSQRSDWTTRTLATSTPADPTCATPSNLNASGITASEATITWTPGGNETAWVLEVSGTGATNQYNVTSNPSYTLTGLAANNAYTIRVKAVCSETSQSAWSQPELFQTSTTGISDVLGESFKLYPNPASVSVTIQLDEAGHVSLLDAAGRESGRWTTESGHLTIDLNGYAAGAYYVRVVTAQGTAVRKLLVR